VLLPGIVVTIGSSIITKFRNPKMCETAPRLQWNGTPYNLYKRINPRSKLNNDKS